MSLYDSLAVAGRPAESKIYGVMVGIVTNNKDPEGLGRVKLKLPLRSNQYETDWARVVTFMGGSQKGAFFLPEVNDEVLVAFNEGDLHRPYVIGSLWNSNNKPPESNSDGKNNIRTIKSRSGHEIILKDQSGSESITVKSSKGHTILLDDAGGGKLEVKDKSGNNKVVMNSTPGDITIQAQTKVVIKVGGCTVTVDNTKVEITSAAQLKISSQMLDIQAGAMMNIKSGGILNIQGALVKIN